MRYEYPKYSREEVNRAGKEFVTLSTSKVSDLFRSIEIIYNWRAAHAYPTQNIFVTLKQHAKKVYKNALVAQRIKRLPSIIDKLEREKQMKLSQMQDIGGCRVVLQNISQVHRLQQRIEASRWKHKKLEGKNYIDNPKTSGYRGIHLKYRYCGTGDKSVYDDLKIEIQLRTKLQHVWATAVEAADVFTKQAIKSSRGKPEWERFFALMGSIFAMREKCQPVPNTPNSYDELRSEIVSLCNNHDMVNIFVGYASAIKIVDNRKDKNDYYFLITLNPIDKLVAIRSFNKKSQKLANNEYVKAEQSLPKDSPNQIVLVSVSSISSLKRIYPNYFLDTRDFVQEVRGVISGQTHAS
jgi:hypothetical protein